MITIAGGWLAWNHRKAGEAAAPAGAAEAGWQKRAPAPARKIADTPVRTAAAEPAALAAVPADAPAPPPAAAEAAATPPDAAPQPPIAALPVPPQIQAIFASDGGLFSNYYNGLFRRLNFTPDQAAQFRGLLDNAVLDAVNALPPGGRDQLANNPELVSQVLAATEANLGTQLQAQFGDAVYQAYRQDRQTLPERMVVDQLQQTLQSSPTPLTDDEAALLVQILARTTPSAMRLPTGSRITPDTVSQASTVLGPEQLQALQALQQQQAAGN
ncbi:MAG TPA: hypothetical protein VG838_15860 [Opitutaceae bacterium]|nr:hypothetical protein [Opitutaceae bacterium]